MRSSWKQQRAENSRAMSGHLFTLHQRLYNALNLGLRSDKGRKWHCADIQIQRLVIRSIDAFLDFISSETLQNPLVKDAIADMVRALKGILQLKNEATLSLASNVVLKVVKVVPNSTLQSHILDLFRPLTSLLPSHQTQVALLCATALKLILSNLSSTREREVWEILKDTDAVVQVVNNIQNFSAEAKPLEYFQEMVSLLSKILWRWPPSRFCVWNNAKLMEVLGAINLDHNDSLIVAVLQLYAALALCAYGGQKLLEKGETILFMMEHCMARSNSLSVRMEGFKLAQCLVINEHGCSKVVKMCGEPIVKAIIKGMSSWSSYSGKISKDHMSLLTEACRLALITRWAGEHHNYFWKFGIDKVLLNLLLNNFHKTHRGASFLSAEKQIAIAQEGLNANFLLLLRPFIWDILGGLTAHCSEDFNPKLYGNELCINLLITCACMAFVDSIQVCQSNVSDTFRSESACRSVLMMIYSPCEYIASEARSVLSQILRPHGKEYLKYFLDKVNSSRNKFGVPDNLQLIINLISLACYSGLPQYREHVIKYQGMKILVGFVKWSLSNDIRIKRSKLAPHLYSTSIERTCCMDHLEDWDGEDMPLLFSLWGLAELMHHSGCIKIHSDILSGQMDYDEAQLVSELQRICCDITSPGPRWFAAYILSCFGYYGFPSKLGERIGKALNDKELSDLKLIPRDGEPLYVHGIILMVRCPLLLPCEELPLNERSSVGSFKRKDAEKCARSRNEVRLSAQVERQAFLKLLEYVYLGYLEAGEELVKKLRILARHCNLRCLLQMLCKKIPKWGIPVPTLDLTFALGPAGHNFSDIILEAKATNQTHWTCSTCYLSTPHMHVHKVILWSSCDYFQAMFQSEMQERYSDNIKVPISWEALLKLVNWFYSDELPKPVSGCLWDNMDVEDKLSELHPYVELCWLAEFWLMGAFQEHCTRVVTSCLDSARELSIKIIQIAANLSQWEITEAAAKQMAPLYHQLRKSGELEALDEELVDMVRAASVRLSRDAGSDRD